jgi:hypothetical protein
MSYVAECCSVEERFLLLVLQQGSDEGIAMSPLNMLAQDCQ